MLAKLDQRTREAKLLSDARAALVVHVGGSPSHVQKTLIERAARLMLYLEIMDRETLEAGTMSERNSRQYLAWTNSLRLTLRELGLKAAPAEKLPDLRDDHRRAWDGPMTARAFSILDAIRDERLFGAAFRDASTWRAWQAFLAALFGLPMSEEQAEVYRACTGRSGLPDRPFREAWLVCGRRSGKSFIMALIAVFSRLLSRLSSRFLVPARRRPS